MLIHKRKNTLFPFDIPTLSFSFSEYKDGHEGKDMEKLFEEVSFLSPPIVQPRTILMNIVI